MGELMPSRFSGEGATDADDWAKDFRNYIRIRSVTPDFAVMLLENRLTGTARQRLENQPENINFDELMNRFTRRFGMNEGTRNQLLATFWTRKQILSRNRTVSEIPRSCCLLKLMVQCVLSLVTAV